MAPNYHVLASKFPVADELVGNTLIHLKKMHIFNEVKHPQRKWPANTVVRSEKRRVYALACARLSDSIVRRRCLSYLLRNSHRFWKGAGDVDPSG